MKWFPTEGPAYGFEFVDQGNKNINTCPDDTTLHIVYSRGSTSAGLGSVGSMLIVGLGLASLCSGERGFMYSSDGYSSRTIH